MKNILKTLQAQKEEVEQQFTQLDQRRQSSIQSTQRLQAELNELTSEMARLQGEHRRILKLLEDFKDVPNVTEK